MVNSMTGFASMTGQLEDTSWTWEIRSVNNKGYDLRVRLPEGCEALEKSLKAAASNRFARGTIYASLKVNMDHRLGALDVDDDALTAVLSAIEVVDNKSKNMNVSLANTTAIDILSMPGVLQTDVADKTSDWIKDALQQIPDLLDAFADARADEGAALRDILTAQLDQVSTLLGSATTAAETRQDAVLDKMKKAITAVISTHDTLDADRLEQEVALVMVKNDVSEELDRLVAHVNAATELLAEPNPIGRKFDFLMQEFNREANTLCSKSNSTDLTRIGVDMKTIIDQMREQVQNVE